MFSVPLAGDRLPNSPHQSERNSAMRLSLFSVTVILVCTAVPAPAQTVIDVEEPKAASPQVQDQGESQHQDQAPTQSPERPRLAPQGRFSFTPVENGFLRLDNDNGQIAYCSAQTVGWACQSVPENRATLETEINQLQDDIASLKKFETEVARLQDEVASLKKEIAALKEPPPRPSADVTPLPDKGSDAVVKLPTHVDVTRARDFIEETWRRLVEMIVTIQKDMMRKG